MKLETSENFDIRGTLSLNNGTVTMRDGQITRTWIAENSNAEFPVRLDNLRVWDDLASLLPGTASSDDLAVIEGTFGTDAPTVQTSDAKVSTTTQRTRFQFALPDNYVSGATLTLRVRAGMVTTVSDTTATLDAECYVYDDDGAVGSDVCTTSAQSINSLTKANYSFTITPTGLTAGDTLDIRLTIAITDGATGTAVIGEISKIALLVDVI